MALASSHSFINVNSFGLSYHWITALALVFFLIRYFTDRNVIETAHQFVGRKRCVGWSSFNFFVFAFENPHFFNFVRKHKLAHFLTQTNVRCLTLCWAVWVVAIWHLLYKTFLFFWYRPVLFMNKLRIWTFCKYDFIL